MQGSSLVAAITAAGIAQPLLIPLGLGDENGKALAALAVGAGAMTVAHINDDLFWLVSVSAGARPLRALAMLYDRDFGAGRRGCGSAVGTRRIGLRRLISFGVAASTSLISRR